MDLLKNGSKIVAGKFINILLIVIKKLITQMNFDVAYEFMRCIIGS